MEITSLLQYIIIGIIAISGIFIGKILSMIAPEELSSSKKTLILLQKILFFLFLLVSIIFMDVILIRVIALGAMILFLLSARTSVLYDNNNYYLIFTVLGLLMGSFPIGRMILPAFIVFLIGIPTAILNYKKKVEMFIKLTMVFIIFFIISIFFIVN